jgi:hypothetical protein
MRQLACDLKCALEVRTGLIEPSLSDICIPQMQEGQGNFRPVAGPLRKIKGAREALPSFIQPPGADQQPPPRPIEHDAEFEVVRMLALKCSGSSRHDGICLVMLTGVSQRGAESDL